MMTTGKQWRGFGLGLWIMWQLFYLAVANGLETLEVVSHKFPETSASITKILDQSRRGEHPKELGPLSSLIFVVDKYGQVTEQPQRWSLFAPNISDQTAFLTYEFRWNGQEQSVWLLSDDEPEDPSAYLRVLGNRVRSLEQNLTISFAYEADETEEQARQRWRSEIQDKLARDFDILVAWSALRVRQFQADFPETPVPDEVILHIRGYEIPAPGSHSTVATPYCLPLARWMPAAEYPAEVLPIDAFDPVNEQFVQVPWTTEVQP